MAAENEPYRYNYQALDKLFSESCDPKELGNQLDEIMSDLVYLARDEDDFGRSLTYHPLHPSPTPRYFLVATSKE